jgi:acetate kinase
MTIQWAQGAPRTPRVLVLNAGSSSLKHAVFENLLPVESKTIELNNNGISLSEAVNAVFAHQNGRPLDVVAYRIVHGGSELVSPTRVTPDTISKLLATVHLAPLHQKPAITTIETAMACSAESLHIACFDTSFHATMPFEEKLLPLPREMYETGIRRFGFHGLSYESIAAQLPQHSSRAAHGRTVVCHLGNGASLCGMIGCRSEYTTMGFTPQDGLIMGTRAGRIDSGVILHLLRNNHSADEIEQLLTKRSGLLGISSITSDMRELIHQSADRFEARQAVDMFCRCVAKEIVAAATAIGGLDAIVWTAGIGEHCALVRTKVIEQLKWIGAKLDETMNQVNSHQLHSASSTVEILRIPTDEQSIIAQHAIKLFENLQSRNDQGITQ